MRRSDAGGYLGLGAPLHRSMVWAAEFYVRTLIQDTLLDDMDSDSTAVRTARPLQCIRGAFLDRAGMSAGDARLRLRAGLRWAASTDETSRLAIGTWRRLVTSTHPPANNS